MIFQLFFYKTALNMAIERNYSEIAILLLSNESIDVNIPNISSIVFYIIIKHII